MVDINKLREYGADVDTGLARCMNNEVFYLKLVVKSLGDNAFDKLNESLDANDLDAAFEAAHSLKGVMGNLALTPIYDPMVEITELLRSRTEMDYSALRNQINEKKAELKELCK